MTPRDAVHQLVDELSDDELDSVERYIRSIRQEADPVLKALMEAPISYEPLTAEELAGIQRGIKDFEEGRYVSLEEAERRLLRPKRAVALSPSRAKKRR